MSNSKPLLAYWDLRGLAEPIRLMMEYSQMEYEQKLFRVGPAPEYSRACWMDIKESSGLDFPNLPYYVDGDVKICESWAIMRHIARANNLLPEGTVANALCDQAQGVVQDFRMSFVMLCYQPNFDENKKNFFASLPVKMTRFNNYLGKHKWLAGDKLTYIDFAMAEILDQLQLMENDVYDKYPNVKAYLNNFMKQEKIAAYRNSSKFKKFPCNNRMARWGGGDTQD